MCIGSLYVETKLRLSHVEVNGIRRVAVADSLVMFIENEE